MRQTSLFEFKYTKKHTENAIDVIRERASVYGTSPLSNEEVLSLLVGEEHVESVVSLIQSYQYPGLINLAGKTVQELEYTGISKHTALTILAALELGKRIMKEEKRDLPDWSSPEAIASFVMEDMRYLPHETFRAAFLNNKNGLLAVKTLSDGTIAQCVANSRDVLKWALVYNAASIVLLHNHPSGNPAPSGADKATTRRIVQAAKQVEIAVIDHIVIGDGTYFSFCEHNLI